MIMKTSKDITLNIGKEIYTVNTSIDSNAIDRMRELIDEACGEITKGAKQEDILMLACLRLAYSLDAVSEKLRAALGELGTMA